MHEHIPEPVHCVGHGGFLQDVSITFTKNTAGKDPFRVTKEDYKIRTLKIYAHFGIKIGIKVRYEPHSGSEIN